MGRSQRPSKSRLVSDRRLTIEPCDLASGRDQTSSAAARAPPHPLFSFRGRVSRSTKLLKKQKRKLGVMRTRFWNPPPSSRSRQIGFAAMMIALPCFRVCAARSFYSFRLTAVYRITVASAIRTLSCGIPTRIILLPTKTKKKKT